MWTETRRSIFRILTSQRTRSGEKPKWIFLHMEVQAGESIPISALTKPMQQTPDLDVGEPGLWVFSAVTVPGWSVVGGTKAILSKVKKRVPVPIITGRTPWINRWFPQRIPLQEPGNPPQQKLGSAIRDRENTMPEIYFVDTIIQSMQVDIRHDELMPLVIPEYFHPTQYPPE
ncbi:hypothetical protein VTI74DRAFT_4752 [Chaetomium olivicolor]